MTTSCSVRRAACSTPSMPTGRGSQSLRRDNVVFSRLRLFDAVLRLAEAVLLRSSLGCGGSLPLPLQRPLLLDRTFPVSLHDGLPVLAHPVSSRRAVVDQSSDRRFGAVRAVRWRRRDGWSIRAASGRPPYQWDLS